MKLLNVTRILISGLLFFVISASQAEQLLMARTTQNFPETMLKLQETLGKFDYKVSRVQRIDIGLTKSGFSTDKYRVVFYGKADEVKSISENYPHLIPYIPWKIAIFAEQQDTLLITADPMQFTNKQFPGADKFLLKWKKDIEDILTIMRSAE